MLHTTIAPHSIVCWTIFIYGSGFNPLSEWRCESVLDCAILDSRNVAFDRHDFQLVLARTNGGRPEFKFQTHLQDQASVEAVAFANAKNSTQ